MGGQPIRRDEITPPNVLRFGAGRPRRQDGATRPLGWRRPPLRPIVVGSVCALAFGFVAGIGPCAVVTRSLLGTADAQEAPARPRATAAAEPSEADRAALRYFARQGDVDRLEAELRRLRALYPNWTPPRDLLDPQSADTELQRVYDLVGQQRYDEARRALAERQQRDPTFEPPERLVALIELAQIRGELRAASERGDFNGVLRVAEANERILTCDDVDSLWRVAQAFARTERPQRAYDAYAYVIANCTDANAKAASLQKAAIELDPSYVTRLFGSGGGAAEFAAAELDIIRGAIARGGNVEGTRIPQEWLDILVDAARTGADLQDAMLIGYYLYRQGLPADAAQWFRFALDSGLGADAAEGYIVALRATGSRDDEFLAREVAYEWREQTPELMEAYLDAVATVLAADELGQTAIQDVEQGTVDRFVPVVIGQRDANGAQALGWYAFNTCQFIIAEEWFITSANWVPTEAAVFGLALTRLRLGDRAGFEEVVAEWGALYPSVRGLATGEDLDPADPVTGGADDPTDEVGVNAVVCDPTERERLRDRIAKQRGALETQQPLSFTEAGSLTVPVVRVDQLSHRPTGAARPAIPRRSAVISPGGSAAGGRLVEVQAEAPLPLPPAPGTPALPQQGDGGPISRPTAPVAPPQPVAPLGPTAQPGAPHDAPARQRNAAGGASESIIRQRALANDPRFRDTRAVTTARRRNAAVDDVPAAPAAAGQGEAGDTVARRVRQGEAVAGGAADQRVRSIVGRGGARSATRSGGGGAEQALANRNYAGCVAASNSALRDRTLSGAEAAARGFCLLELDRPVEAAQAFSLAQATTRFGTRARGDAAYGATLAALASEATGRAAYEAAAYPQSRARRTEVQTEILTQRAVAANRAGQPVAALYYLNERNKIAPLQKDLMLLQGFAYRDAGDVVSGRKVLSAVNAAGPTAATLRAVGDVEASQRAGRSFR